MTIGGGSEDDDEAPPPPSSSSTLLLLLISVTAAACCFLVLLMTTLLPAGDLGEREKKREERSRFRGRRAHVLCFSLLSAAAFSDSSLA